MTTLTAVLGGLLLVTLGVVRQDPALPDLLKAGAAYVAAYATRVSATTLEEHYTLTEIAAGRMMVPKRLASDVFFLNANGQVVVLRDAYAVDTRPLRERTPRIATAVKVMTQEGLDQAHEYAKQSAHLFLSNIVLRGSDPTLAFQFLDSSNQPALTYRLDGRKKVNGVAVVGLRFQEPTERNKVYLLRTPGNAHGSGRFWIDPATGAVHQIDLFLESPTESASVSVQFAADAALGFLLPRELSGTFQERVLAGPPSSATPITQSRRFEVIAKYSNARQAPIK